MKKVPQLVWRRLPSEDDAGPHPDPGLLSAFEERALSDEDRGVVFAHLAGCPACRDVVFLSRPQASAAAPQAMAHKVGHGRSWLGLRWGAAVACSAAAAIAFFAYPRPQQPRLASELPALSSPLEADQAATPAAAMRASRELPIPAPKRKRAGDQTAEEDRLRRTPPRNALTAVPTFSTQLANEGGARVATPAASETAQNQAEENQTADEPEAGSDDRSLLGAGSRLEPLADTLVAEWRVSPAGSLSRSWDGGKTWEGVSVDSQAILRVVSVWRRQVWVGGLGGALYQSPDYGEHWVQMTPAANGEILRGEITAIQFPDPGRALVTTRSGEGWSTSDAGQTWQRH